MAQKPQLIVGLDIGTTKTCAVVAEVQPSGALDVLGFGSTPSRGLRKGVLVNMDATVQSIKHAVGEAQRMAGCEVEEVYVGIAGGHIEGRNGRGVVQLKTREVGQADLARVIQAAHAQALPAEREIIHILPQEFILDQQDGIREPLGMSGSRLEARVHVVTGSASSAQNITRCVQRAGLQVADLVLEQLASSEAVLDDDERDLGVALLDVGGGTTALAIWSDGSIVHTQVLPIGGDHITADIAAGLCTPMEDAEQIKRTHGCAMAALLAGDTPFEVPSVGGRPPKSIGRQLLCEIIEPRVEELFTLVQQQIARAGYADLLASGVVLTGGATLLPGMTELAEDILRLPCRRAVPGKLGGLGDLVKDPRHATCVGLVTYGRAHEGNPHLLVRRPNAYAKVKDKVRNWLGEIF